MTADAEKRLRNAVADPQGDIAAHTTAYDLRALLDEVARLREDAEAETPLEDAVALQVISRVFRDWSPVWERWLAYDKSQWLWWGRALGGFVALEMSSKTTSDKCAFEGTPTAWHIVFPYDPEESLVTTSESVLNEKLAEANRKMLFVSVTPLFAPSKVSP